MLLVDAPAISAEAIQRVLGLFSIKISCITIEHLANYEATTVDISLPVIAGSYQSWTFLKSANLWRDSDPFVKCDGLPIRDGRDDIPFVVPACAFPNDQLIDEIASSGDRIINFVARVLIGFRDSNQKTRLAVWRAAARSVAVRDRHTVLRRKGGHEEDDLHGALRVMHGAVLAGTITPAEGVITYKECCRDEDIQRFSLKFFSLSIPAMSKRNRLTTAFCSVLLIDDETFWPKVLTRIFEPLGIDILQAASGRMDDSRDSIRSVVDNAVHPVRAVILDLRFPGDAHLGMTILRQISAIYPWLPVIVFTVHDRFSDANLLKRLNAFCYISKSPSAPRAGARDELTAFFQIRDGTAFACWASITQDLKSLFDAISETSPIFSDGGMGKYVTGALLTLREECKHLFNFTWQDAEYPAGLAYRQMIRAMGLVNDRWCQVFANASDGGFDCDCDPDAWNSDRVKLKSWPHRPYQQIVTTLRNHASHAMIPDDEFHWIDPWIMILSLWGNIAGMTDLTAHKRQPLDKIDGIIGRIATIVWHLLAMNGEAQLDPKRLGVLGDAELIQSAALLESKMPKRDDPVTEKYLSAHVGEVTIGEKSIGKEFIASESWPPDFQLGFATYFLRHTKNGPFLWQVPTEVITIRTTNEMKLDLLIMLLVLLRVDAVPNTVRAVALNLSVGL